MKAQPTVLEEQAAEMNPNLDVIAGLCELVEFLSAHPELPHVWLAYAHVDCDRENPRAHMRLLADALGDEAKEEVLNGDVAISGTFTGGVKVAMRTPVSKLANTPPVPKYKPIIEPPADIPVGAGDFDV